MTKQNQILSDKITKAFAGWKREVKRKASGIIKHDYLVPAGPYEEQWDWDGFFIGMALSMELPSEGIYLKNWALNYLEHTKKNGFTPGLLTPQGRDLRLNHIKPFLAQGIYFSSNFLDDFSWYGKHWSVLKKSVTYREKFLWDKERGLGCWYDGMESGADNNVAALDYAPGTVVGADLNAFLYREYKAMALLAKKINKTKDYKIFDRKAKTLKKNINKHLWDRKDKSYYNLDRTSGELIKRVTYSNIIPLWAGLAAPANGKAMIKKYLINPKEMWGDYGIRTLSKQDPDYNNANIIKPHSNWQGPVWPIANYLYFGALLNYKFTKKSLILAEKITKLCLTDLDKFGGMHENYHAESGKSLAAPNFVSWNLLVGLMLIQADKQENPFVL